MLQHVRIKLKHGDARETAFTTYSIFVMVVYNDNASIFETINSEQNQKTTLTEYFQANIDYPLARKITYMDFPFCLYGPMGRKNGPSNKEGAVSNAFISSVLPLVNAISCVHC
jgi:hypothetical protein